MTNFTRPGASSSTVWMALARTEAWRVNGLVTAGKRAMREVWMAAWPRVTKVSRHRSWLSRMPAPSKPAASMVWRSFIRFAMGAVPGTRMWTRTGSFMTVLSSGRWKVRLAEGGGDLASPAAHERARVGDEAGDDELVGARRHRPPDLGHAVVRRAHDAEAIGEELREPPALGEERVAALRDLVVVRVVLALEPPDLLVEVERDALALEREPEGVIGAGRQRHGDGGHGGLARVRHVGLGEPPDVEIGKDSPGGPRAALDGGEGQADHLGGQPKSHD